MIIISIIGFIANGKEAEFSAEVLVAICFVLFIIFLVYAIRSMVFNSLNDELFKTFTEFDSIYKLKEKEVELLVENYNKINSLKEDLIEINIFLESKLSNIIESRQLMLSNYINKLLRNRLNNITQAEQSISEGIHLNLVNSIISMYSRLNLEYSNQKVWSDNIASINSLSSTNLNVNNNSEVDNINLIKNI